MAIPFDEAFGPEFMGLLARGIPAADVVPNPMPSTAPSAGLLGGGPSAVPVAAPTATVSPDMQMLEQLLAGGSIGKGMSLGDKLTTLGAVLSAAAYGGSPAEVMQNARGQQIASIQSRMQLAQLRAKQQQDAALAANREALIRTLPKEFQDQARTMDAEKRGTWLSNLRMQPTYKRVQEDGKWKTKVIYQQSGLVEDAPFELPGNLEKGFLNGQAVWFDKDTGLPFIDPTTGKPALAGDPMTPKERADLGLATARLQLSQQNAARAAARGSGGGEKEKEAKDIWIPGPGGQPMKVRGISQGGNRYKVGNTIVEAVPSPARGRDDEYGL